MNHYTYVIYNKNTDEYYIGVRSCECSPQDDSYMGSPAKPIRHRFKREPGWTKFIIGEYATREEAAKDEFDLIQGHLGNGKCLNQCSGGCTWYRDIPHTQEVRRKISDAARASNSNPETIKKMSDSLKTTFALPVIKEKITKVRNDPNVIAKQSRTMRETLKARWLALHTPEQVQSYRNAIAFGRSGKLNGWAQTAMHFGVDANRLARFAAGINKEWLAA